jgi:hypothetical protein
MNASSLGDTSTWAPHRAERFSPQRRSYDDDTPIREPRLQPWQDGIKEWYWVFGDGHDYVEHMAFSECWRGACCQEGSGAEWAINGNHNHFYYGPGLYNGSLTVTDDDEYELLGADKTDTLGFKVLAFDMELFADKYLIAVGELVPAYLYFEPYPCETGYLKMEIGQFQGWYIDDVKVWADPYRHVQLVPTAGYWDLSSFSPTTVWIEALEPGYAAVDLKFLINSAEETCRERLVLKAVQVNITVNLEDPQVNGVRSGLDESTLRFELNGVVIPNSSLTIGRTYELIDGENVLTNMSISYHPSGSELTFGTNTVKVDIDDMVDNHMPQLVQTFEI